MLSDCDEIILDMARDGGDVFLTDELKDFASLDEKSRTALDIEEIHKKLQYCRDEYAFAVLFKTVVMIIIGRFAKRDNNIDTRIERNFYTKHKNFIDLLWYWIVYYNLWYPIQFFGTIVLAFYLP
jgi:hypothetical protein